MELFVVINFIPRKSVAFDSLSIFW